eukprot:CFRG0175T1
MVIERSAEHFYDNSEQRCTYPVFDDESSPLLNTDNELLEDHVAPREEDRDRMDKLNIYAYGNHLGPTSLHLPSNRTPSSTTTKTTWRVIFAACVAASGASFQFGYHVGDYGAAAIDISALGKMPGEPTNTWSLIQYMGELMGFLLGGLMGAICGGAFANRFGRRKTLLLNDFTFVAGATLMAFSRYFWVWVAGRMLIGFGSGVGTIVVPLYCSEISPAHVRGALSAVHQLFIALGIVVSALLSMQVVLGSTARWPLLLGVSSSLAIVHFCVFSFCPESPRYLYSRGVEVSLVGSLQRLRGTNLVDAELKDMHIEVESERRLQDLSYGEILSDKALRRLLWTGVILHLGQQLSGINAIIVYSVDLFSFSSLKAPDTDLAIVGSVNFVFTFIASVCLLDRIGRKTLLVYAYVAMFILSLMLGVSSTIGVYWQHPSRVFNLAIVIGFVSAYAIGPGPVSWIVPVEMYPLAIRAKMLGVCVCANWIAQFLCLFGFLVLKHFIGPLTLVVFAGINMALALFCHRCLIETNNITSRDVLALWSSDPPRRYSYIDDRDTVEKSLLSNDGDSSDGLLHSPATSSVGIARYSSISPTTSFFDQQDDNVASSAS